MEPVRIVIVGGGAGGIGAAGAARQQNPEAEVVLFTDFEDVGYSPCGIPFVHGNEIERFEDLILRDKEFYVEAGFDFRYQRRVESFHPERHQLEVAEEGTVSYDRLILATGFEYESPDVPGSDLEGLYYVKDIRHAMAMDERFERARTGVVAYATPIGVEMATAMAHRGIETHMFDPHSWVMGDTADPDIMERAERSLEELGVTLHMRTELEAFVGDNGQVRAVRTTDGELPADLVAVCTHKKANTQLAREAGLKVGSTGGLVVDERMATSAPDVYAAGDCVEVPHALYNIPIQGLLGTHAYSQGRVAGANAAGGDRWYQPVYVPWGMMAGKWMIGGVAFGETMADGLGIPYVLGQAEGISRARYYPGTHKILVKLLADPKTERLIGAQMVGGEGIKERADFLAMCVKKGITIDDLAWMENVYSPPIGALAEPIAQAAQNRVANR